jgi:hypothetical protein
MTAARYTGRLDRQPDGTLAWELFDFCGWRLSGTAVKDPAGGYKMSGVLGEVPEALRFPIVDDAQPIPELSLPVRVPFGELP